MKTNPLNERAGRENSAGSGMAAREMVREPAVEAPVINNRSARDVSKSDQDEAKRELAGDPVPKAAVLESAHPSEHGDPLAGDETRSEQAIRASELSYRRLFEAAKDGILILDVGTGRISDVNPFLIAMLGFSHGEMIGKTIGELSPFKDMESNQAMLERLQKDGYVRYDNLPLETRDGRKIAVEFVSNVYPAGDRNVIQCNVRDITERKRTDEQLKASFKEIGDLKSALDEHAIVAITDPQGKITYANDKFCAISQYSREELLGQDHRLINSGFHPKEFIRELWTTITHGKVWKGEIKNKAKDGSFYWVDATIVPFLNEHGRPRQYVSIRTDITERKTVEEALCKSEVQLQTILENLGEGVAVSDLNGQLLHFNRAALDQHGFASLDECRRHLTEYAETFELSGMDGKVWPVDQWPLARVLRGEKLRNLEVRIRRFQTDWRRVFSYGGTLVHDAGGRSLMAVVTISDLTERELAAMEIRQLNAELEQRIVERTAQLQTTNDELQAFSYSVSHDLRAPLRHVMGFVDLLQKDAGPSLSEKSLHHLTTISSAAKRMGDLIDDLLAFSQIGRSEMQKTEVNLDQLVRKILGDFQIETKERNIVWNIHPLPGVRCDRSLLRMVFVNLLSNAVKFTGTRAEARIEIGSIPNGDDETVIFIRDNGVGFDPQYAGKLFGVFQRLHSTVEFEGTGIGLANVQRIIHRHGGRTWAEGAVDGGATFYFSIPKQNGGIHGH